eukprot:10093850-Karenia_brevis.AAC.1
MGSTERKLDYESCRKYVVSVAHQRISARIPRPAEIGGVDQEMLVNKRRKIRSQEHMIIEVEM